MFFINKSNTLLACAISSALLVSACDSDSNNNNSRITDQESKHPTNVILMIADGASDGAWDIASYWENGDLANNSAPYSELTTRLAMTTFPINSEGQASTSCDGETRQISYDKDKVWDETVIDEVDGDHTRPFAGYSYINKDATDSAAAGTALATGHKTYNGAISMNYCGQPLETITQIAKAQGLSTGIVTSVEYDHATPAVFGANNLSRNNYAEIGHSMLSLGHADLIMGAGHPEFDDNGKARASDDLNYKYVSESDWTALLAGMLKPAGSESAWSLIESKADFEALANNTASAELLTTPLFGLAQAGYTLHQGRSCAPDKNAELAFDCAMNENVPSLQTMTKGALNYLGQNNKGFFLMVEGGAVDWAAHGNQTARIIEEQIDFTHSVSAVVAWVEENSNWEDTLLIVTTDHGNSYVLGGTSNQNAYAPVVNPGKGGMPEVKYYSGSHTNELVRVYAKGKGAEELATYIDGKDVDYTAHYNHKGASGDYIDNTNIFDVMRAVIVATEAE